MDYWNTGLLEPSPEDSGRARERPVIVAGGSEQYWNNDINVTIIH